MIRAIESNYVLRRLYFQKSEVEKIMIVSCLFSIALAFARVIYTGELITLNLIWNLMLAVIPYQISTFISQESKRENKVLVAVSFIVWLLFIPNSFYIITDLFHLRDRPIVSLWFDLALILSFAWNGLLFGVLSVRQMERMVERQWQVAHELFFIYPIMWLNAFGIYLGRYLRFNSWDVLTNPFPLVREIVLMIIHPLRNKFDWGMILCFSVFMTLIYIALKRISKAIA